MIIGTPRERKTLEKRVALTPDGAKELTSRGHTVLIEKDAGIGSGFGNDLYESAGCQMVDTLEDVWTRSELVVKVKEPHESEYQFFRPGLAIFDYLHLASMPELAAKLVETKITGIAFELVRSSDGRYPLLDPMSEVAGKLSVLNGANLLLSQNNGRGVLLAGTSTIPARRVTIIGAGVAGQAACEAALGMGARVTLLDNNVDKLHNIKVRFGNAPRTVFSTPQSIAIEAAKADLLIGAVLIPGAHAPRLITRETMSRMKPNSVFVDISIDQGGCAETIRPTNLDNPAYLEEGVLHYGVCNMPAQVPRTSTMALSLVTLPYVIQLADKGIVKAMQENQSLKDALNTCNGKLTNKAVSGAVNIDYTPIDEVLK
ncbi:MAG: alanine dehydrogenase [Deltaproteobacteria bacterium]|nr:alanine dehydrogenase [Deltaproteobacteria bacterium]